MPLQFQLLCARRPWRGANMGRAQGQLCEALQAIKALVGVRDEV